MKIKSMLTGIGAALVLAAGLAGFAGTAAAEPKPVKPSASPAPVPAEDRPTAKSTAGPEEPVVVRPAYTG
ncbi:hypothetical protein [Streptosporangium carneum]|uniref:Uncharacterized protein n=1 Tax=Streptosporangium carneum TaxID=47481 RepID=A0A9W6HZT1_9ACTN|nr:hypothetical protein [Streptosporangium carneum]GLK09390.1 hypothetical protein GCM10017600_27960 [Streptosporangium carneum]